MGVVMGVGVGMGVGVSVCADVDISVSVDIGDGVGVGARVLHPPPVSSNRRPLAWPEDLQPRRSRNPAR